MKLTDEQMDALWEWSPTVYDFARAIEAALTEKQEPCDMGEMCLNCQPRGPNGECPDKAPVAEQEPVPGEPLPCPFCGHTELNHHEGSTFRWLVTECSYCGAQCGETRINTLNMDRDAAIEDAKKRAIAEWNTRHPAPVNQQLLDNLHDVKRKLEWFVDSYPQDVATSRHDFFASINYAIQAAEKEKV